jgi:hypothetical protein
MSEFEVYMFGCQYITTRRQTTSRTASEAEIDDILCMLYLLDNANVPNIIQFIAISIGRILKYGSNETNVCAVVDRQIHISTKFTELKNPLHTTTANTDEHIEQFTAASEKIVEAEHARLTSATYMINGQLQQLAVICRNIQVQTSSAPKINSQTRAGLSAPIDDGVANVDWRIFGLSEDRNNSVWNSVLLKALQHVASRPVEITDAFRIGKFNANQIRPRPIIV